MADLKLDIFVLQTYSSKTMAFSDASVYPNDPPEVTSPTMRITPPGFDEISLPFVIGTYNVFNSASLRLSEVGVETPLPDGVWQVGYTVFDTATQCVTKTFMRVDKIQEKFDNAFMTLEMMECDRALKTQASVELNSIWFFIQGSIASANNCAIIQSEKLYAQADKMLDRFLSNDCGCSGTLNTY
jgi:hypothetical protein